MAEYAAAEIASWREQLTSLLGKDAQHYPKCLEASFPHILGKIATLWGKPELDAYLDGLMVTERTDRHGFPDDVAMEIFHLSTIHASLHLSDAASGTGWAGIQDPELLYRKALKKE